MNRRLLSAIVIIIVLFSGIAFSLFFFAKKQKQQVQRPAVVAQIKKVLDEPVISPVPSLNNSSIWYFNQQGRLFSADLDGSNLSEFPLPALSFKSALVKAVWQKDGPDFIAITSGALALVKNYYNSGAQFYTTLASNIQSFDWLDGKRIVYIWKSSDNASQYLAVADADGSGFKTINSVFYLDLTVKASPDGKTALLYRSIIEDDVNKIYAADLTTGEITTVIGQGKNLAANWFPSGSRFLFSQSSFAQAYPKIYMYDFITNQAVDLDLNTSLDKVAVDNDGKYLYAAVPKKDNSGDTFVKIDLSNFKSETYFEPVSEVRARSLILIGSAVYFTDNRDSKLYTISK